MGLPNFQRYQLTQHARERYKERIDKNATNIEIHKEIQGIMHHVEYLSTESNHCEVWIHRERNILLVVDPVNYRVVTIQNSLENHLNGKKRKEAVSTMENNEIMTDKLHPRVKQLLDDFSRDALKTEERKYYGLLGPLYKDYGDRTDKLSRTRNPEYYNEGKEELRFLELEIKSITEEQGAVLNQLKMFHLDN